MVTDACVQRICISFKRCYKSIKILVMKKILLNLFNNINKRANSCLNNLVLYILGMFLFLGSSKHILAEKENF